MTDTARTGQSLVIVASTMLFAAFTSALVVRRAAGGFETPQLPPWLLATALLALAASCLLAAGRPRLAAAAGAALVAAQLLYIGTLRTGAIDQAFQFVFIGAHTAHAAAGALAVAIHGERARLFWHFAGALWVYVLALMGVWA